MNDLDTEDRHPLADFAFCPHCGYHRPQLSSSKAIRCPACGFVYYANASAAVACVIIDANDYLLAVRRAYEPYVGTLDLPGGFVDPGESIEEAAQREVAEETALHIEQLRYLFSLPNIYPFSGHHVHTTDLFFVATVNNEDKAMAHDDVGEIVRIPLADLIPQDFGLPSIRIAIEKIIADKSILRP